MNIDKCRPHQEREEKIYLEGEELSKDLLEEAKSWVKLELSCYTVYYGQVHYRGELYNGVMYVEYEQKLKEDHQYMDQTFKEYSKMNRRLNVIREKTHTDEKHLKESLEEVLNALKYHTLDYRTFVLKPENNKMRVKKRRGKNQTYYSFIYCLKEKEMPDFSRYQMCLYRNLPNNLNKEVNEHDYFIIEKSFENFLK